MANQKTWIMRITETDMDPTHQGNPVSAYQTGNKYIPASGLNEGRSIPEYLSKLVYQMLELSKLGRDREIAIST